MKDKDIMALTILPEDVQIELLEVLANICLSKSMYNKLVPVDYNVNVDVLKGFFIIYYKITDEEFEAKFPTGIPAFKADTRLFTNYIQIFKDKNFPEFDDYVESLDEMYISILNTESNGIWIEDVVMSTSYDSDNNPFKMPIVYLGGVVVEY
jgi:hypothetical protein